MNKKIYKFINIYGQKWTWTKGTSPFVPHLVNQSTESVYGKILAGISFGLDGDRLVDFVVNHF